MANKELLLQYMEAHPELFDGSQNEDDDVSLRMLKEIFLLLPIPIKHIRIMHENL
jgi:hypothetical protein